MGMSMFQVKKGINLDGLTQVMSGAGAPGAAGAASLAPVGSIYLDATNGQLYVKKSSGVGTDKWLRAQDSSDMSAAMVGISWREPVKVRDATAYADLAAATTAMNTGTLDGTAVVANDRILFTNIAGVNKNVFIVTGTPGSGATLVEDGNALSKGDTLYVNAGTDAGKTFNYNGTIWVQQGGASSTEIGYLQSFVGKNGDGNGMPEYNDANVALDGDSLLTAVTKLDDKFGVISDGEVTTAAGTVADNLAALDNGLTLGLTFSGKVFTATAVGDGTADAVDNLGDFTATVDFVGAEWRVVVSNAANTSRWAATVFAICTSGGMDYNISGVLHVGTPIPGLDVTVFDYGSGVISLLVEADAGNAVNVIGVRTLIGSPV